MCSINKAFQTITPVLLFETIYLHRLKSTPNIPNPLAQFKRQNNTGTTPLMFLDVPLGSRYEPQSSKSFIFFPGLFVSPFRKCIERQTVVCTMAGAQFCACRNLMTALWHDSARSRQLTCMLQTWNLVLWGPNFLVLIRSTPNKF